MKITTTISCVAIMALASALILTVHENASLRSKMNPTKYSEKKQVHPPHSKRPERPKIRPLKTTPSAPMPKEPSEIVTPEAVDEAVKLRIAEMHAKRKAERERRRELIKNLTPEEKEAQRKAFVARMRERSSQRMHDFVAKTCLNAEQTKAFEDTVTALDTSLSEAANMWAEKIRSTKSFNQDSKVKFVSDMSAILSAGYCEMDATLPETWKTSDGNVNLMEIVGPEALSPVVEALTDTGLDDGLQTVGTVMGGPEGGDQGEGGSGDFGNDSRCDGGPEGGPGTGGGPGSGPSGFGGGPGGM